MADTVTVRFENVGRNKLSWTAELSELSEKYLDKEVGRKGALMSRYLEYDLETGLIFAGMRAVGRFFKVQSETVIQE